MEQRKFDLTNVSYEDIWHLYDSELETEKHRLEKEDWLRTQIALGKTFTFKQDLIQYGINDSIILLKALCFFLKQTFTDQMNLIKLMGKPPEWSEHKKEKLIFPFTKINPTLSSNMFRILKQYSLPRDTFYVSTDPYGKNIAISSHIERECFYVLKQLGNKIEGFDANIERHVQFGDQIVDGYMRTLFEVVQFFGCYRHPHKFCSTLKTGGWP